MIQLIKAATLGTSKQERVIAEQKILQLRLQNTSTFFTESCGILQNDQLPANIRQAAGTVIDMSILTQIPQGYLWDNLQPNIKQNVKDSVLSALIDQDRNIRRAAANIVAAICCIQIPRNQWEGIIQKISSNIGNSDLLIKEVSILTLGFICERLKTKKAFVFSLNLQELILSGILLGLKESQKSLIETALKGLLDGVSSMSDILNNPQYRDYMINQVVQIIQNPQYRNYGLQILRQFTKGSYQHLGHYINGLIPLIQSIITNTKQQDNCIQAMQLWETVASEYKERLEEDPNVANYITGANGEKIVSWLLGNLCVVEENDDNQENGIVDSASKCLQTIFQEDSSEYQKLVLAFTTNTIKHQSWKYRQASIRAFALFLIGTDEKRKQQLVDASLLQLVALLNDQSQQVQYSAIKSINLITQQSGSSFLHHNNFIDILKLVVGKLTLSQGFLKNVCKILDNLCQQCQLTQSLQFNPIADDLIQLLFDTSFTQNSSLHVINCCILTIMNLISVSYNSAVSLKYISFVVNYFDNIKKQPTEKRQLLYASFFTLLQTCLITLRKETINVDLLTSIYQLVINHYKNINEVDSDGLYVVGTLSNFFRDNTQLVEDFWKYIEYALSRFRQSHIFKAAISCICDFAAIYGPNLGTRIPIIMNIIISALQNPQVSKQPKLDLIMCLGQMFLNCGQCCLPYLQQSMRLIIIACQASISMNQSDRQYAQSLRQNVIQTLTCMLHGLNDDQKPCKELLPSIENIFQFIKISCNKSLQPKVIYIKACVLWMTDVAKFYKQNTHKQVKQQWVWECLELLKKHNKNGNMDDAISYAKSYF